MRLKKNMQVVLTVMLVAVVLLANGYPASADIPVDNFVKDGSEGCVINGIYHDMIQVTENVFMAVNPDNPKDIHVMGCFNSDYNLKENPEKIPEFVRQYQEEMLLVSNQMYSSCSLEDIIEVRLQTGCSSMDSGFISWGSVGSALDFVAQYSNEDDLTYSQQRILNKTIEWLIENGIDY